MLKNIKKQFASKEKSKAGFAILFSVLMASFLITLGISIFSISLKEIMITTSTRDSQIAYYIADSARECALYWDVKRGAFPRCTDSSCTSFLDADGNSVTAANTINVPVTCNGVEVILPFNKNASIFTYSATQQNFFKASSTPSAPVSDISITKQWSIDKTITTIEARGHNTGIIGRRVERGIQQINN